MVLFYILIAVVLINILYYILFTKFAFASSKAHDKPTKVFNISVIICAKNESENLKENIPSFLAQEYPKFELILINDASSDDTLEVMEEFAKHDSRIKIVNVENNEAFWGSKKYALTLGIKKAENLRMLFSDADCKPASNHWISEMAAHFSQEKQLILGYGGYVKKKGLLNKIIRFETFMTAIQYFSYAKANMPYMGVGRNLGYTSKLYYNVNGFMTHMKIPSGDDDLFVNEAGTGKNTTICFSENAITYSQPKTSWSTWLYQKRRHISTASLYKPAHKILLASYYIFNLLFWLVAPLALIFDNWKMVLPLIIFKWIVQGIILAKASAKLKERDLLYFFPFYELFLLFAQMSIFISSGGAKQAQWK